jgi:DNA-binding LacI/PurR family transcriptional regulator
MMGAMEPLPLTSVRIRDVAARAGVGVATVSRVLNGRANVAAPTRMRVQTAIRELDYRPSTLARNLSLGRTLVIGVVVPFLTSPSAVVRLRGVVEILASSAYDLALIDVESEDRRRGAFDVLGRADRTDGLLVISMIPDDDEVQRLRQARIPCVLVDGAHPALPHLIVDDVAGGELATRHLLELGHRSIAFIGDKPYDPYRPGSTRDRTAGYAQALLDAGIPLRHEYIRAGTQSREQARETTLSLLRLVERPTAIFAASDLQALGVLEAAAEQGLRVPDQLSVVGFDDIEIAPFAGLTTVRQPLHESGRRGTELLLDLLSGEPEPPPLTLPLELIERRTTAPPPR